LLAALTGRASVAFTVIPGGANASEFYRKESPYEVDNLLGETVLDTRLWWDPATWNDEVGAITPIKRGGTGEFLRNLSLWSLTSELGLFGWDFEIAQEDLEGNFEIVTNEACGYDDGCGGASTPIRPILRGIYRGVGSLFHVKYHPAGNDPRPSERKLHWIQMVQANYKGTLPGFPVVVIDNGRRKDTPYYDYPNFRFAGEDFLMDQAYASGRSNARSSRYFNAQL
jgi:hypothetical protein